MDSEIHVKTFFQKATNRNSPIETVFRSTLEAYLFWPIAVALSVFSRLRYALLNFVKNALLIKFVFSCML